MRKLMYLLLGAVLFVNTGQADEKVFTTDVNKLPENSRLFLSTHFNDMKISHISMEKNWLGVKDYDVILTDGTEVEFHKNGEWKDINRKGKPVPETVMLPAIADYVKTNFPESYVVGLEKDGRIIEVKLNNGIELDFDSKGMIRKIDH